LLNREKVEQHREINDIVDANLFRDGMERHCFFESAGARPTSSPPRCFFDEPA
jgi:hypothetical protein